MKQQLDMHPKTQLPTDGERILAIQADGDYGIIGKYNAESGRVVSLLNWTDPKLDEFDGWLPVSVLRLPIPF